MPSSYRFVCKNNGVLFENQLLQIGIKSEYRQNLGELSSQKSGRGMVGFVDTWTWFGMIWVFFSYECKSSVTWCGCAL